MTKDEIALQLTIAMLDKKLPYNANSNAEMGAAGPAGGEMPRAGAAERDLRL